jgi:hypothetical protein
MNSNDSNTLLTNLLDSSPTATAIVTVSSTVDSRDFNTIAIKSKIADLSAALLDKNPRMPMLLRDIHTHISKDPELATLISEEEIGIIVSGLKVQTNTELVTTATKAASSIAGKKKMSQLTIDDI